MVTKEDKTVEATRLMGIMGMAVKQGQTVKVTVEGGNEEEDCETIRRFFEENL